MIKRLIGSSPKHFAAIALTLAACSRPKGTPSSSLAGFEGHIAVHAVETGPKETAPNEHDFTVTAKGGKLRIDIPPPNPAPKVPAVTLGHVVYDRSENRALIFFDSTKEYRELDLSKRIAPDPLGGARGPALTKTGGHKVIADLPCDEETLQGADEGHATVCLAGGLSYLEIFRVRLGPHGVESPIAREFREHSTFPLEWVESDKTGKEPLRMRVTRIERGPVDDAVFATPDDYTKVDPHFDTPPDKGHSP